jgi:RNA polymerase sigma factor (TIGR02999 family)
MTAGSEVTRLLHAWREGNERALDSLLPLVYEELRAIASASFRGERAGHTLQPTALVHEAYVRLASADIDWNDRAHFFAIAARTMRRLLVDHAREHGAAKRGGDWLQATLDTGLDLAGGPPLEILDLDRALDRFARQDARAASAVELHYFGGLSHEETASVLDVSPATIDRDLRLARAWLRRALADDTTGGGDDS